ncbi:MAG: hypothetical protein ABWX98_06110 [Lacisediminihabitans sp.]
MIDLGLLFDVDGPLASPVSRTIRIESIRRDLVTLAAAGVPIAVHTGRSDAVVREFLVRPLFDDGLAAALATPGARMFGVFEKGGSWAPITAEGMGEVTVDPTVALPDSIVADIRRLIETEYADTTFFDETKRAMISVEQRTDVPSAVYKEAQARFDQQAFEIIAAAGLGIRLGDREVQDAAGLVPFRIDPTIISTDIESVALDKDRGAQRALEYFAELGPLPHVWRSVGDSRSDYLMADYLHREGFDTGHLDVRPSDGVLERDYPIITIGDDIHDEATAKFLTHWVEKVARTVD